MKINKVLAELESLVVEPKDDEISEKRARKLNYQVEEYKRQEKHLQEIIEKERLDLADYISMKMARIEALSEMFEGASTKRGELEQTLQGIKIKIEKSC
ncbi:hypothetical protein KUA25_06040 [Bacteroidales bacterium MSK.15.36]|nr:hypothetical protein [Bacteroidales bacterium MSK.15.36]